MWVPVVHVDPRYKTAQCSVNVCHCVRERGGKAVNGWQIFELRHVTSLSFHCIWESPDGELIDITPAAQGETEMLFLPIPIRVSDVDEAK